MAVLSPTAAGGSGHTSIPCNNGCAPTLTDPAFHATCPVSVHLHRCALLCVGVTWCAVVWGGVQEEEARLIAEEEAKEEAARKAIEEEKARKKAKQKEKVCT